MTAEGGEPVTRKLCGHGSIIAILEGKVWDSG